MKNVRPISDPKELASKILGSNFLWPIIAGGLILLFAINFVRMGKVSGEEVGVLLDKRTGKIELINQSGVKIYNGITQEFFTLNKTIQTIEMTSTSGSGDRKGRDDLKIKTIDGSDVYMDVLVQYRINAAEAVKIIETSGIKEAYKDKEWAQSRFEANWDGGADEAKIDKKYYSVNLGAEIHDMIEKALAEVKLKAP